jgi:membrane-bound lytic murein transglycosylase D
MNKPVILAAGTPQILLPYDNANRFVRALPEHKGALATWTAWVAPKTMRPSELAKHVGMDEDHLRDVNRIPPRVQVVAGSTLVVPRSELRTEDVAEHIADNGSIAFASDGPATRRVMFKVGKRESVASVAKRYRVSASQLAQWNGVAAGSTFAAGHTVIVHVVQKASARAGIKTDSVRASRSVSAKRRSR